MNDYEPFSGAGELITERGDELIKYGISRNNLSHIIGNGLNNAKLFLINDSERECRQVINYLNHYLALVEEEPVLFMMEVMGDGLYSGAKSNVFEYLQSFFEFAKLL